MGIWDSVKAFFGMLPRSGVATRDPNGVYFHFLCSRCGSVVQVRADRRNDFNRFDAGVGPSSLLLRKDVMDNTCYQLMGGEMWLDSSYTPVSRTGTGGKLITPDAYDEAIAALREPATPAE